MLTISREYRNFFEILALIILIFTSAYVFWYGLRFTLNTEVPIAVVEGTSMKPKLREGDLVVIRGVRDVSSIEVGDIILFYSPVNPEMYVIHRVINKVNIYGEWYFQTKGDNNPFPDRHLVSSDNVIGRVIFVIPYVGWISKIMHTVLGPLIIGILIIIVLFSGIQYQKEKKPS